MYKQIEKSKDRKSRAAANSATQKKSGVARGFGPVDSRQDRIIQKRYNLSTTANQNEPMATSENRGEGTKGSHRHEATDIFQKKKVTQREKINMTAPCSLITHFSETHTWGNYDMVREQDKFRIIQQDEKTYWSKYIIEEYGLLEYLHNLAEKINSADNWTRDNNVNYDKLQADIIDEQGIPTTVIVNVKNGTIYLGGFPRSGDTPDELYFAAESQALDPDHIPK